MTITAEMVKELRERTGSGMMECKKALVEAGGDLDVAVANMRKAGLAKADKKSSRTAAEGCIAIKLSDDGKRGALVEVNSETDFVAKSDEFVAFANAVAGCALRHETTDVAALLAADLESGISVDHARRELVAKLGENIAVRRLVYMVSDVGRVASYIHGAKIGVLVDIDGGVPELGRDIAMHVAASKPVCVDEKDVAEELIAKEREIFVAQAETSGKPQDIIAKMVEGRIRKYLAEVTLVGQPFVKDPDQSVGKLLSSQGAAVKAFVRLEVGEGIEKETTDFASEVMAQVRNNA